MHINFLNKLISMKFVFLYSLILCIVQLSVYVFFAIDLEVIDGPVYEDFSIKNEMNALREKQGFITNEQYKYFEEKLDTLSLEKSREKIEIPPAELKLLNKRSSLHLLRAQNLAMIFGAALWLLSFFFIEGDNQFEIFAALFFPFLFMGLGLMAPTSLIITMFIIGLVFFYKAEKNTK